MLVTTKPGLVVAGPGGASRLGAQRRLRRVYSGPDVGTTFPLKAATTAAAEHPLPVMTLTRGARHLAFLPGGQALVFLQGEIEHKNLWTIDLQTGAERQLTNLPADFDIRDFDVSPYGREVVLDRVQERSDVVLLDLPRP